MAKKYDGWAKKELKKVPYKILIPRVTISNNNLIRMHYRARMNIRDTWKDEVAVACGHVPSVSTYEKRKVRIFSYRHRRLDKDNFNGGLKPLIDALRHNKLIYDDNPRYFEYEAEQRIDREDLRTEIFIYIKK